MCCADVLRDHTAVTTPAAGETTQSLADNSGRTDKPELKDDRFTMCSLLTRDETRDETRVTWFARASGRIFDAVNAALGSVLFNGRRLAHHGSFAHALGAPICGSGFQKSRA